MPITASDWAVLNPTNQTTPVTMPAANTIAPTTFFTILTGNVVIKTITPPVQHSHTLCIEFAGVAGVDATGNIKTLQASVVGVAMLLVYNPAIQKYTPVM